MQTEARPVYKRTTRDTNTESEEIENVFHVNGNQKKAEVAILRKKQTLNFWNKRQGRTLYNAQGINPRRRYNNCKYICTQHRRTSICMPNANSHKRGNKE